MLRGYPVQGALDLAAVGRRSSAAGRVVRAPELCGRAVVLVSYHIHAADEVRMAQPDLTLRCEAKELSGRILHEVVVLDVEDARERHRTRTHCGIVRMVGRVEPFHLAFGIVLDDHAQRIKNGHGPGSMPVQILAHAVLEHAHIYRGIGSRDADTFTEVAYRSRRVAPPAETHDRRQSRVVPSPDMATGDELVQLAFAHYGVIEIEPRELDLPGP